ncbi:MAG: toxin-antitoxin system YwqK family antitoxin [Gelidibacter sp.]|uniref:toxin-antitoxin system YwqK family antitoxin n=1 Tax=Gelidibacter sp. TaxID=2018083 RepID=UPI003265AFB8
MIKQNIILGLFLTLFLTPMLAQDLINQLDNDGKRHGLWRKDFDNTTQPRYEGVFEHGKEVGLFKFYKMDGKKSVLSATREFSANNNNIIVKFYSSKGKLISEGQMVGKLFVGKWVYYHNKTNGIMIVEHYNDQGQLDGERLVYYPKGQLAEQTNYVNGKQNGNSKVFSENGVVIKDFLYKDDMLDGMAKYYNAAGQLLAEGVYRNDKKHGIWKYYENGVLSEEKDFTVYSKNPGKQ